MRLCDIIIKKINEEKKKIINVGREIGRKRDRRKRSRDSQINEQFGFRKMPIRVRSGFQAVAFT